ncbi:hypothetical protein OC842_007840, partial [Tilletia horrida]
PPIPATPAQEAERARVLQGLDESHVGAHLLADHLSGWVNLPLPYVEPANSLKLITATESRTLRQYKRWLETRQTTAAWRANSDTFREEKVPIHTLRRAERLVQRISGLSPVRHDMCVNSCIAYVGKYRLLKRCPFIRTIDGVQVLCGERRFKKPRYPGD